MSIEHVQCCGKTRNKKQCDRKVCPLEKFCFQHSNQKLVYKERHFAIDPAKLVYHNHTPCEKVVKGCRACALINCAKQSA